MHRSTQLDGKVNRAIPTFRSTDCTATKRLLDTTLAQVTSTVIRRAAASPASFAPPHSIHSTAFARLSAADLARTLRYFADMATHPVPNGIAGWARFLVGDSIPNTTETEASGAIRDVIAPNCPQYAQLVNNSNPLVSFIDDPLGQSNRMSVRLSTKLDVLAQSIRTVATSLGVPAGVPVLVRELLPLHLISACGLRFVMQEVTQAYRFPPANPSDASLFNEGRALLVSFPPTPVGTNPSTSELMRFAAGAGFDYAHFVNPTTLHLSVRPDSCTAPLDLMFLLDASGSIEGTEFGGSPGTFSQKVRTGPVQTELLSAQRV